jgi:hypothetical protein
MWDPTPREWKGADIAEDKVHDLLPEKKREKKTGRFAEAPAGTPAETAAEQEEISGRTR